MLLMSSELLAESPSRLVRFISDGGKPCMGRLINADEGVPSTIENLGKSLPSLCGAVNDADQLQQVLSAFDYMSANQPNSAAVEKISRDQLDRRILPPLQIGPVSLQQGQRIIIGADLNAVVEPRDNSTLASLSADDLLLFPKPVPPSAPYKDVELGYRSGTNEAVELLDYDVELAIILLQEVDLMRLPEELLFSNQIAYVLATDLSDREPIILAPDTGYLQGKSKSGYLPLGPWMIHGSELEPRWQFGGRTNLSLSLLVQDRDSFMLRTDLEGTSSQMPFNGYRVLQVLADRFRRGGLTCMQDQFGQRGHYHDGQGKLPAGSLILTGTMGSTAFKVPSRTENLLLLLDAGFSLKQTRVQLLNQQIESADSLGYLEAGDLVYSAISSLGRQRWQVATNSQPPLLSSASPTCQ
jgi:2-keto-4-pentenoate hydratase/2-oxohepta-3-ene-1,7-dioic acid hydratase in catechol pathway